MIFFEKTKKAPGTQEPFSGGLWSRLRSLDLRSLEVRALLGVSFGNADELPVG
jgi:hypothetical protein